MILRQRQPLNLECPFEQLDDLLTPVESFYIRNHFPVPKLEENEYRLQVDGAVKNPLALTLADLRGLPAKTQLATLECAGNARVFLVPQVEGAQWGLGAVGTAEWTGVSLGELLQRAGYSEEASEVVLEGADCGTPKETPKPHGEIIYARSISIEKALAAETIVAYQMNGRDLPPDHGYPARAIVPGHYGMASVKWLTRIHVIREQFKGYWQTSDYAYWDVLDGEAVRRPLARLSLKAAIARPAMYETIQAGQTYEIYGAAWSDDAVKKVEVSTDGGERWGEADFVDPARCFTWRRWRYVWQTPKRAGRCTVLARATDARGRVQPEKHNPDNGSYVIDHILAIEVFVG